jgi:NAD(P)-dependent dehydrogenase (short-subunit alcohol dehydrogenase family)
MEKAEVVMRFHFAPVSDSPIVVVSGASSGIGEDTALFLNRLGYTVAAGIRHDSDGDSLRAKAVVPDSLHPVVCDVTSDEQVCSARQVVDELLVTGRRFAGVFSNAGVAHYEGDTSSEGTPMSVLESTMDVNFFGAVRFIRAFLPAARASRSTVVINSALMARTVLPFNAGYAATKCALEGWADSLRREIAPFGVRVVLIEAAAVSTGLTNHDADAVSDDNPYPAQRPFLQKSFQSLQTHRDNPRCSPRRVSELVAHALQAQRPRSRYHVGGGANAIYAVGGLPVGLQDRVLKRLVSSSAHDSSAVGR